MPQSTQTTKSLKAVSMGNAESASSALSYNTAMAADIGLLLDSSNVSNLQKSRESNRGAATGFGEPDEWYDHGMMSSTFPLSFQQPQFHHLEFIAGFGLGNANAPVQLTGTNLYQKLIYPTTSEDLPSFTGYERYGGGLRAKRRLMGLMIASWAMRWDRTNNFLELSAESTGSGKFESNVIRDTIVSTADAAYVDLNNAVEGSTAADRLIAVQKVLVDLDGDTKFETQLTPTAVTDTPGTFRRVTFTAPSTATDAVSYQVVYIGEESTTATWATGLDQARLSEPPMRVTEARLLHNPGWDGSNVTAGWSDGCDIDTFEWTGDNQLKTPARCLDGEGDGDYADQIERGDLVQQLVFGARAKKWHWQAELESNTTEPSQYALILEIESRVEASMGRPFFARVYFPKIALMDGPLAEDDGNLSETLTMDVGWDSTVGYSVLVEIHNLWSSGVAQLAA